MTIVLKKASEELQSFDTYQYSGITSIKNRNRQGVRRPPLNAINNVYDDFAEEAEDIHNMEQREECAFCAKTRGRNTSHPIQKCFAVRNSHSMVDMDLRILYANISAIGLICRVGYRPVIEERLQEKGLKISMLQQVQSRYLGQPANADSERDSFSETAEGWRFKACGCSLGVALESATPGKERDVITGNMMFECKINRAMRYLMQMSARPQERISMLQHNPQEDREHAEEQLQQIILSLQEGDAPSRG